MRKPIICMCLCILLVLAGCGTKLSVRNAQNKSTLVFQGKMIEHSEGFAGGDGSADDPFQIENEKQLALLQYVLSDEGNEDSAYDYRTYRDAYYVLTNDIYLNPDFDNSTCSDAVPEYGWKPIDNFKGHLDGQGHCISGLYIDFILVGVASTYGDKDVGLFSCVRNAEICDINIKNSFIRVNAASVNVGTLAGTAYDSEFSSCLVESTFLINSAYSVGGIIGAMSNTSVTDAMSSGVIDMTEVKTECSMVGGLVGEIKAGSLDKEKEPVLTIKNFCNRTIIDTRADKVGGMTGMIYTYDRSNLKLDECINEGIIKGNSKVGGIAGEVDGATGKKAYSNITVEKCKNDGDVFGETTVGGIIGEINGNEADFSVISCENSGSVWARDTSGGIVGQVSPTKKSGKIEECTNSGTVSADMNYIGGIIGTVYNNLLNKNADYSVSIIHDHNTGDIKNEYGNVLAGGILGGGDAGVFTVNIDECLNEGKIAVGKDSVIVGGIIGRGTNSMDVHERTYYISECVNKADILIGDAAMTYGKDTFIPDGETITKRSNDTSCIGGIAGTFDNGSIKESLSIGNVYLNSRSLVFTSKEESTAVNKHMEQGYPVSIGGVVGRNYINKVKADRDIHCTIEDSFFTEPYINAVCVVSDEDVDAISINNVKQCSKNDADKEAENLTGWLQK